MLAVADASHSCALRFGSTHMQDIGRECWISYIHNSGCIEILEVSMSWRRRFIGHITIQSSTISHLHPHPSRIEAKSSIISYPKPTTPSTLPNNPSTSPLHSLKNNKQLPIPRKRQKIIRLPHTLPRRLRSQLHTPPIHKRRYKKLKFHHCNITPQTSSRAF